MTASDSPDSVVSPPARRTWPAGTATLGRALLVLIVSGGIGAGYNYSRLTGGAMLAHTRYVPGPDRLHRFYTLDEAAEAFEQGEAIFVDSRAEARFMAAHIPGAISIPYDRTEEHLKRADDWIPHDATIIIYGQAQEFKQLYEVEAAFIDAGYEPYLMRENFGMWQDRRLPIATGAETIWEGQ